MTDDRDGRRLTDDEDSRKPSKDVGKPDQEGSDSREQLVRLLVGRICCLLGLLFGVGGLVGAFFGAGASVTPGAVGAMLGIVGYFLGSRRLGTVTVLLCVAALFFGLAASQGLIPGIDASDRNLPDNEPAAE
ncbi:MAG: hypothetical protein AVDCRST_MAG01-01-5217 [uncultured Rubrobacteraceae bacterium]|uniref:Uncharacterized protein n=1 Tax=uncultured Rubrobacteraceae bacterium TaxID=349277 RepID=A0A6J4QUZ6_9ACTN|nr:MAG: hypothetical protein AVDCRST_MAG01-01-5217 [uncultured Rubrobacteraceae bacterium]